MGGRQGEAPVSGGQSHKQREERPGVRHSYELHEYGGLTLAGHQVPTKAL